MDNVISKFLFKYCGSILMDLQDQGTLESVAEGIAKTLGCSAEEVLVQITDTIVV